jgi:hypothetical protein
MIRGACRWLSRCRPSGWMRRLPLLGALALLLAGGLGGCRSTETLKHLPPAPPPEEEFEAPPSDSVIEEETLAVPPSPPPSPVPGAPEEEAPDRARRPQAPLSSPGAAPMGSAPAQPTPGR